MGCLPFNRPRATTNHNRSANCSKYGAAHACLLPMAMVASSLSWGNTPQPCRPCYDIAVTRPRPRPGIALLAETPATPVDPYKLTKQTKHAAIRASNTATEQTAVLHAPFPTPNPLWGGPGHTLPAALSTTCDMGRVCLTGVGGWKSLTGRGTGPPVSRQIGRRFLGTLNTGAVPDWHRHSAALTVPSTSSFLNLQASLSLSASALLAMRRHGPHSVLPSSTHFCLKLCRHIQPFTCAPPHAAPLQFAQALCGPPVMRCEKPSQILEKTLTSARFRFGDRSLGSVGAERPRRSSHHDDKPTCSACRVSNQHSSGPHSASWLGFRGLPQPNRPRRGAAHAGERRLPSTGNGNARLA
jgi:hypothetical protein